MELGGGPVQQPAGLPSRPSSDDWLVGSGLSLEQRGQKTAQSLGERALAVAANSSPPAHGQESLTL